MKRSTAPRDESVMLDTPLHSRITDILAAKGHPRPAEWTAGLTQDVFNAEVPLNAQRFFINRYWRDQLGRLPINTMNVRYCLVDEGDFEHWLVLFREQVAPCIVENNLPPAVH